MKRAQRILKVCASFAALVTGCEDGPILPQEVEPPVDPGALVRVSFDSEVGVLLDEFPEWMRAKVADGVASRPESFWRARASEQARLTFVRLNYRGLYYPDDPKGQLPLPPEPAQRFEFDGAGPRRVTAGGHDMVVWGYHFDSHLVTTIDSVAASEPLLADTGGTWDEVVMLPTDPTLLFERTGYACMSELGPPPESVDTENAYGFYDDTCFVEVPTAPICHFTMPGPSESCIEALDRVTGRVEGAIHYERVAWDDGIAAANRIGEILQPDYTDLAVRSESLKNNYIVYRYIPPGHCTLEEKCVNAPGWRRLLMFDAADENVGGKPLHIGPVNYALDGDETEVSMFGMFEFSECHNHYHFEHYGEFSLGGVEGPLGRKVGFCLLNTDRFTNHELSPIYTPYSYCDNQGIEVGWTDTYQAGLACQWLDVTDSEVKGEAVEATIRFRSNPDGFLCEGEPVLDENGKQVWEPTEFMTAEGKPVQRPKCEFFEGSEDNDTGEASASIPEKGSITTSPCTRHQLGPNRNCDFTERNNTLTCTPGAQVKLSCGVADPGRPQVVRVCEYSFALGEGAACSAVAAQATKIIDGTGVDVEFKCPEKRDDTEVGGRYAIFTAPLWNGDGDVPVTCVPAPDP